MRVDNLELTIVAHLPRWVSRWGFIRVAARATEIYHDKTPDQIGLMQALEAWEKKPDAR